MRSQMDFFSVWGSVMSSTEDPDSDAFGVLCDKVFDRVYSDGAQAQKEFRKRLGKVKDREVKESLKEAVEILMDRMRWFFFSMGVAIGTDYDLSHAEARRQIDFLRNRIHDSGIFPMTAKLKATHGKSPGGDCNV